MATLYLDTEAAYYRVARQLAFGNLSEDASVVRIFQYFGLDPSDVADMMEQVLGGGVAAEAGISTAIRHSLKDFHSRSWFVTMYGDGSRVTQTEAGSRPGESWSDIVFGWVYSRILARITEHAVAEDLVDVLPVDISQGPFAGVDSCDDTVASDATWADDSAWPLSDSDPNALVLKAKRLCALVIEFCQQHGLKPNLKPGDGPSGQGLAAGPQKALSGRWTGTEP